MSQEEPQSQPLGYNLSPPHDVIRSNHDLDDKRHRSDHYDNYNHCCGLPGPLGHGIEVIVGHVDDMIEELLMITLMINNVITTVTIWKLPSSMSRLT